MIICVSYNSLGKSKILYSYFIADKIKNITVNGWHYDKSQKLVKVANKNSDSNVSASCHELVENTFGWKI